MIVVKSLNAIKPTDNTFAIMISREIRDERLYSAIAAVDVINHNMNYAINIYLRFLLYRLVKHRIIFIVCACLNNIINDKMDISLACIYVL